MEQIQFLHKFIKLYGFSGINDFKTKISCSQLKKKDNFIKNINVFMPELKKHFKPSTLNLARKKYVIDTHQLALSILKNCLQQSNIGFEIIKTSKTNMLRLRKPNILFINYIKCMDNINKNIENIYNVEDLILDDLKFTLENQIKKLKTPLQNSNVDHLKKLIVNAINDDTVSSYPQELITKKTPTQYVNLEKVFSELTTSHVSHTTDPLKTLAIFGDNHCVFKNKRINYSVGNNLHRKSDKLICEIEIPRHCDVIDHFSIYVFNKNGIRCDELIKNVNISVDDFVISKNFRSIKFPFAIPSAAIVFNKLLINIEFRKFDMDLVHSIAYICYNEGFLSSNIRKILCQDYTFHLLDSNIVRKNGYFLPDKINIPDNFYDPFTIEYIRFSDDSIFIPRKADLITKICAYFVDDSGKTEFDGKLELLFNDAMIITNNYCESIIPIHNLTFTELKIRTTSNTSTDKIILYEITYKNLEKHKLKKIMQPLSIDFGCICYGLFTDNKNSKFTHINDLKIL